MATYNITKSDGSAGPAIPDAASPDTQTDLQLVGQNAVSYGLDVAQSFYFLLENFSKNAPPTNGDVVGQLWFDKDAGAGAAGPNAVLNLWNGSAWKPLASTAIGTSVDTMARWDNSAKTWTENTHLTLSATGTLTLFDSADTDSVAFSHDGTDFNIVGDATADINITGVTAVNMPSVTLVTVLDETYGGTGVITYATGDILTATGADVLTALTVGSNGDVLTVVAGEPVWQAGGAGVAALNDLSDVTLTTPDNNSILYRAAGQYIDSNIANLSFDGTDLSATQIGGIVEANLIDRAAPGTLTATIFSGVVTFQDNLDLQDNDKILFGTGDDVAVDFDNASGDFDIVAASAVDFNITGFSGALKVAAPIYSIGGGELKVLGTTSSNSTNEGFVSVNHNDDGQTQIRMGTRSGSSFSEVNALVDDLNLYAANTLVMNLDPNLTTLTAASNTAMTWRQVTGNDITTSASVGDANAVARNVGFNETPTSTISGARTIDADDIGKFLTRTASTSRVITLDNDSTIPIGGSLVVHNGNIGGTLTIVEGTITSLTWIDGSGTTPATGTRTVANNSVVTLRKATTTTWQIWGNGIS